ncbi:MAG: hypothetical protein KF813_12340, partial [Trueperaceae bacterium]|nr:hypothetical protein [Trueperaceae bacterium]
RAYGDAIAKIVKAVCPQAFEAFEEHILHGRELARSELEVLKQAIDSEKLAAALAASGMRPRRRAEFLAKLGIDEAALPGMEAVSGANSEQPES